MIYDLSEFPFPYRYVLFYYQQFHAWDQIILLIAIHAKYLKSAYTGTWQAARFKRNYFKKRGWQRDGICISLLLKRLGNKRRLARGNEGCSMWILNVCLQYSTTQKSAIFKGKYGLWCQHSEEMREMLDIIHHVQYLALDIKPRATN